MKKIAALYDVRGIQAFIFSSTKLKENIGASTAVQKVVDSFLKESIHIACSNAVTGWEKYPEIKIKGQELDAEIVYIGGGNAMVIFKDEIIYNKVNRQLSKKILEETGGEIKVASAGVESNLSDFKNDRKILVKKLRENKLQAIHSSPLLGIAITREGETDGLPAQCFQQDANIHISFAARQKRKFEADDSFENRIPLPDFLEYPKELDYLGQKEGENHIAVVHIDGNNMGSKIKDLQSYEDMKEFSLKINEIYNHAMKSVIEKIIHALKNRDFFQGLNLKISGSKKYFLPIRVIVLNGDDVTFVTNGRIGIPLAEAFLNHIAGQSIKVGNRTIPLSACAGAAVVKSHFPFYRAYRMAEELCSSAKLKGKILAASNQKEMGNWLDFHIVYSGVTTDLVSLRKRLYNVPGMEPVKSLQYPEFASQPDMKHECFNLLWRPWCIAGDCENKYKWQKLKKIAAYFKETDEWPRSRLKKLRNESIKSKPDIDLLLEELKSRRKTLPGFENSNDYFRENHTQTPYFDALELLDFYVPLPGSKENHNREKNHDTGNAFII